MNRREFLQATLLKALPQESQEAQILKLMVKVAELESAQQNGSQASFMRDQKLLDMVQVLRGEDQSVFTYYGEIIKLVADD